MAIEKFCTKCGKKFIATGREVICPECKAHAAEDAKRAAVLKAKRASWNGESVPVRISGRASTIIRQYGKANNLSFAESLDALLKASDYFVGMNIKWENVEPYKSRRRDKHTTETHDAQTAQEVKQAAQDGTQAAGKPQEVAKAAKVANKNTTSKATAKKAVKTVKTSKTASKPASSKKE